MIDDYTIGNSKAAVNLMRALKTPEYSIYAHAVLSSLSKHFTFTKAIMCISDVSIREAVLIMCKHRFESIMVDKDIPEVLKTHALCIAAGRFRQLRRIKKG